MSEEVVQLRERGAETEKITINLGYVDLGVSGNGLQLRHLLCHSGVERLTHVPIRDGGVFGQLELERGRLE